jgi:chaperonin GroES
MRQGWSGTRDDRQPMFAPSHKSVNAIRLSEGGGQIVTTATKVVLKPLEDRIVVRTLEAEQTTASGLVIPDTAKEKPQEGEVLAVGPGRFDDAGAKRVPMDVKVGDVVLYSKYGGTEVKYHGEEYLVLSARDVLAIVEK